MPKLGGASRLLLEAGFIPIPRSRCSILAAALALPRSRLLSNTGADGTAGAAEAAGDGNDVVVVVDVTDDTVGILLAAMACLFRTRTASRAAFSTLIADALRLSAGGVDSFRLFGGLFLSGVWGFLLSFDSVRACLAIFAGRTTSLPLFAFLSRKY